MGVAVDRHQRIPLTHGLGKSFERRARLGRSWIFGKSRSVGFVGGLGTTSLGFQRADTQEKGDLRRGIFFALELDALDFDEPLDFVKGFVDRLQRSHGGHLMLFRT